MKVTTDACALGAWVPLEPCHRILDIGTGTGVLALFAAQRAADAKIDAVELDPVAAEQARRNVDASPYRDRIKVYTTDIATFTPAYRYDRLICNPPFFQDSTLNTCSRLSQARHNITLSLPALLAACSRLLQPTGSAFLLLPAEEALQAIERLPTVDLYLRHKLALQSQPGDTPHRLILGLSPSEGDITDAALTLYRAHPVHTREAGQLFYPFYTRLRCEDPRFERE